MIHLCFFFHHVYSHQVPSLNAWMTKIRQSNNSFDLTVKSYS